MNRRLNSGMDRYREFMTKRAYERELEELGLHRFEPHRSSYERKSVQPIAYPSLHPEGPLALWDIPARDAIVCLGSSYVFRVRCRQSSVVLHATMIIC